MYNKLNFFYFRPLSGKVYTPQLLKAPINQLPFPFSSSFTSLTLWDFNEPENNDACYPSVDQLHTGDKVGDFVITHSFSQPSMHSSNIRRREKVSLATQIEEQLCMLSTCSLRTVIIINLTLLYSFLSKANFVFICLSFFLWFWSFCCCCFVILTFIWSTFGQLMLPILQNWMA